MIDLADFNELIDFINFIDSFDSIGSIDSNWLKLTLLTIWYISVLFWNKSVLLTLTSIDSKGSVKEMLPLDKSNFMDRKSAARGQKSNFSVIKCKILDKRDTKLTVLVHAAYNER